MKYVRNNKCMWSKIGNEIVILEPEDGMYLGLNSVAASIWELIQEPSEVENLIFKILEIYDVSYEIASTDIKNTLVDMVNKKMASQID